MADGCRICRGKTAIVATNGLAVVKPFPQPAFDGHVVVATKAHKDLIDVTPDEWQAIGEMIQRLTHDAVGDAGFEKMYLLAIGDVDKGHFHLHVVPKRPDDPGLGPFVFGRDGWNSKRD